VCGEVNLMPRTYTKPIELARDSIPSNHYVPRLDRGEAKWGSYLVVTLGEGRSPKQGNQRRVQIGEIAVV